MVKTKKSDKYNQEVWIFTCPICKGQYKVDHVHPTNEHKITKLKHPTERFLIPPDRSYQ